MQNLSSKVILIVAGLLLIFAFMFYKIRKPPQFANKVTQTQQSLEKPRSTAKFENTIVYIEIVDSIEKSKTGLSNRDSLDEDAGMLFDLGYQNTYPTFWMKDMRFPIDIIWIDDNIVVDITKSAAVPESENELPLYTPAKPIDVVLEVNAGFADKYNIAIGDEVEIAKK